MSKSHKLKGVAPALAAILSLIIFFSLTDRPERSQSWAMVKSAVAISILNNEKYEANYYNDNGQLVVKTGKRLLRDYDTQVATLVTTGKLVVSSLSFFTSWMLFGLLLRLLGMRLDSREEDIIEHARVIDAEELRLLTTEDVSQSRISFSGIPLPGKSDISNLIFCGSSGSGKSVNLRDLLSSIRRSNRKAVVFDPTGEMISHFYRSDKDIILNPLDKRSAAWDVWCDCLRYSDYLQVANTLIPDQPRHENWVTGARLVLAHLAAAEGQEESPDHHRVINTINTLDVTSIKEILQNTEAAPVVAEFGEQACFGIRGLLLASLKSFVETKNDNFRFSVRRWAFNETDSSWLFISTKPSEAEVSKALTATWLNLATRTLMSLHADHLRRVFLVLDDVSATNKIPSLTDYMIRSRRTGASAILTTHSVGMLTNIYGEEDTNVILRACDSIVAMNCNEPSTLQWLSSRLGTKDTIEKTEVSYGNSNQKIFTQRVLKLPLVTDEDISRLPQMQGYVHFGSAFPTARFHSVALEMATIAPRFIPATENFFEIEEHKVQEHEVEEQTDEKIDDKQKEGNIKTADHGCYGVNEGLNIQYIEKRSPDYGERLLKRHLISVRFSRSYLHDCPAGSHP